MISYLILRTLKIATKDIPLHFAGIPKKEKKMSEEKKLTGEEILSDELMRLLHRAGAMSRRMPHHGKDKEAIGQNCRGGRHAGKGRIIDTIRAHGEIPQTKLAQLLGIRPQSLSEAVMKLCEEGIVEKKRSEYDMRVTILSLTEYGEKCSVDMEMGRMKWAEEFMSALTFEEKIELKELLSKLISRREGDRE